MDKDEKLIALQNCRDGAIHQMELATHEENRTYWRGKRDGLDIAIDLIKQMEDEPVTPERLEANSYQLSYENKTNGSLFKKYAKTSMSFDEQEFFVFEVTFSYGNKLVINMYGHNGTNVFTFNLSVDRNVREFKMSELKAMEEMFLP